MSDQSNGTPISAEPLPARESDLEKIEMISRRLRIEQAIAAAPSAMVASMVAANYDGKSDPHAYVRDLSKRYFNDSDGDGDRDKTKGEIIGEKRRQGFGGKLRNSLGQVEKDALDEREEEFAERTGKRSKYTKEQRDALKGERDERLVSALFEARNANIEGADLKLEGGYKDGTASKQELQDAQKAIEDLKKQGYKLDGVDATDGLSRDEKQILRDQLKDISASMQKQGITVSDDMARVTQNYPGRDRDRNRQNGIS